MQIFHYWRIWMKKILVVCSIVILSFFTVGCSKVIELTEDESQIIAEYAAELLLKYDRNIDLKYYDDTEPIVTTTEAVTEEVLDSEEPTEDTTEEITEEDTEEVTTEVATEEDIEDVYDNVTPAASFDVAEFVGLSDMNIYYSHYMLVDSYPSYDQDGVYIEIEAPVGYKLLVLKFDVENAIDEPQYIDLYSMDISYNIIINDQKTAKQMLTILLDDLYTYQKNIEPSMYEEAVVIFQLSDSIAESITDLKLKITYNDKEQYISLE